MTELTWRKSSRSGSDVDNTDCVEVALGETTARVRDSKHPHAVLAFSPATWREFLARLR
ncbi:DUF397 domain-containing protein [Umezawaea beigongshangensis]|uniref:DUF397 domain-containing protein n=1 Tax=Umezawaea beigongshangensis TaxID=2780383 RepID=UPI0018F26FBA|nr:DUF397 domain-containing protein [Umezawaea beigongshangensis]